MEILMALGLVVSLISSHTGPRYMVTELGDGTKVYMKVSKEYLKQDKAMRKAALSIKSSDQREKIRPADSWIE